MLFVKIASVVGVVLATLSASTAHAQVVVYLPYSSLDTMTAQASPPLTLSVKRYKEGEEPRPEPDLQPTTITAKDTDEYGVQGTNPLQKVKRTVETLSCTEKPYSIQLPPHLGPVFRGTSQGGAIPEGTHIWDFLYKGCVTPNTWANQGPQTIPEQVYVNKYIIDDGEAADSQLKDPDVTVSQTITRPAISKT
jgi:hypothetical protein